MKEYRIKSEDHLYNYIRTNGWVVILKDNKPVNYYADHGELDDSYFYTDKPFKLLAEKLKDKLDIVDIIILIVKIRKDSKTW